MVSIHFLFLPSKTGLLGDPAPATSEKDRILMEVCVQQLAAFIEDYRQHRNARIRAFAALFPGIRSQEFLGVCFTARLRREEQFFLG